MTQKTRSRRNQKPLEILGTICSQVDELVLFIDAGGNIREANESAVSRLGIPSAQLIGSLFVDHVVDRPAAVEMLAEGRTDKEPVYTKIDLLNADGESVSLVVCIQKVPTMRDLLAFVGKPLRSLDPETDLASKIYDLERKLTRLQVSLSNMGARLSEKTVQLAEERNKSMAVISNMADGLIVLDESRRISQVNPMTREILNLDDKNLLGNSLEEAIPDLAKAVEKVDESSVSKSGTGPRAAVKFEIAGKTVQALWTFLNDVEGNSVGEVIVLRDVTKEEELARMREELISIVSHEMRSPLTMVSGYTSLVLRGEAGEVPPQQKEFLQIAAQNAERLTRLINDLLDLSRLSSGLSVVNLSRVDAAYLVNLAYYNFQKLAQGKEITLEKSLLEGPVYVTGDDNRLVQVMTNLVSNAVKFTLAGGKVNVWIKRDKDQVILGVTDTGMGIAPSEQRRVFDKFFRTKDVAKRKISGTGLGLPICQAIIQAHKSEISVESTPGIGTTFSFRLAAWDGQETQSIAR